MKSPGPPGLFCVSVLGNPKIAMPLLISGFITNAVAVNAMKKSREQSRNEVHSGEQHRAGDPAQQQRPRGHATSFPAAEGRTRTGAVRTDLDLGH